MIWTKLNKSKSFFYLPYFRILMPWACFRFEHYNLISNTTVTFSQKGCVLYVDTLYTHKNKVKIVYSRYLLSFLKIQSFGSEIGVTSAGRRTGRWYMIYPKPLGRTDKIQRTIQYKFGDGCMNCRKAVSVYNQPSSRLHSRFSDWIYLHSLYRVCIWPQGSVVLKSWISFLNYRVPFIRSCWLCCASCPPPPIFRISETHTTKAFYRLWATFGTYNAFRVLEASLI